MKDFYDVFTATEQAIEKSNSKKESDYIGENGLLYCGSCHTPKQCRIPIPEKMGAGERIVYCICECEKERYAAEQEAIHAGEREIRRRKVFKNGAGTAHTFDSDDEKNPELSRLCKSFADKLPDYDKWLLLYGGCGTGKSFAAECIANVAVDRDISVIFTTVSELERRLWDAENKEQIYDKIARCGLLVLDDIGAERSSDYMKNILFNVIDTRLKSGLPAVITTNLSIKELLEPSDLALRRVFSRVCEKAVPYLINGEDRRREMMFSRAKSELQAMIEL